MKKIFKRFTPILLCIALVLGVFAIQTDFLRDGSDSFSKEVFAANNEWYVAVNGKPTGDGSINNPWDLVTALNHPASVKPGDIIWIRGGTYKTTGYSFTNNLKGTADKPIVVRNYNGERATLDGSGLSMTLRVLGQYTWFWGLEVTDSTGPRVNNNSTWGLNAMGVASYAPGHKFINMVVHNTGQGFSAYAASPDNEFYGNISNANGYIGTDRSHGHGFYLQNETGIKLVEDNFALDNVQIGMQVYGSGAYVSNFTLKGNVSANNGSWPYPSYKYNYAVWGGRERKNNVFEENHSYYSEIACHGVQGCQTGYNGLGNFDASFGLDITARNNVMVGGHTWGVSQQEKVIFTGNKMVNFASGKLSLLHLTKYPDKNYSQYVWDNNEYYTDNGKFYLGTIVLNKDTGNIGTQGNYDEFSRWKADTGFDSNSKLITTKPTGSWIYTKANRYEAKRGNVIIYNWDKAPTVSVDLSKILGVGDQYEIRDAQNFFGNPVVTGTYSGGNVSIPMTGLTKPNIKNMGAVLHTAPEFGTFVGVPKGSVNNNSVTGTNNPPTSTNLPPVVNAGADQTITEGQVAFLRGTANDDGKPGKGLSYTWSKAGGPPDSWVKIENSATYNTNVTYFALPGVYTFGLSVSDGELSGQDSVLVTVLPKGSSLTQAPTVPSFPALPAPRSPSAVFSTVALNPFNSKLDGQWNGMKVASDGNFYFFDSTNADDAGASFFKYNPTTGQTVLIAKDISTILGEKPPTNVPQGKVHSEIIERNGNLFFTTHLANYWDSATDKYTGAHLASYNISTGQFKDYGILKTGGWSSYQCLAVDKQSKYAYASIVPYSTTARKSDGQRVVRIDLSNNTKTDLGRIGSRIGGNFCGAMFLDERGDVWFTAGVADSNLYVIRAGTGNGGIEIFNNALPKVKSYTSDVIDNNQNHRYWQWGRTIDGNRFAFNLWNQNQAGGSIYIFDASKMPDTASAFKEIGFIGGTDMGLDVLGNEVMFIQRNDKSFSQKNDPDSLNTRLRLKGLSLDGSGKVTDYGEITDKNNRIPMRIPTFVTDGKSRIYSVGDWHLLPSDPSNYSSLRHGANDDVANANLVGQYQYLTRGAFMAIYDKNQINIPVVTPNPVPTTPNTPTPTTPVVTSPTTPSTPTPVNAQSGAYSTYFEAEDGTISSPMTVKTGLSSLGSGYVSSSVANSGTVKIVFDAPFDGTYYVWTRILASDFTKDSMFAMISGGNEDVFDMAENAWSDNWQWVRLNGRGGTSKPLSLNPRVFKLTKGSQTLTFKNREAGTLLDKIYITTDPNAVPSDKGVSMQVPTTATPTPTPVTPTIPQVPTTPTTPTTPSVSNKAPTVNIGSDQTIKLSESATLLMVTSDDGLPVGLKPSYSWTKVSGAGNIIFSNSNSKETGATFSQPGVYTLQASVSDGQLSGTDTVNVTVMQVEALPTNPTTPTTPTTPTNTGAQNQTGSSQNTTNLPSAVIDFGFDSSDISGSFVKGNSNSLSAEIKGSPLVVSGKFNQAFRFNGSSDYILMPYVSGIELGNLTMASWIKTTNSTRAEAIASKFSPAGPAKGYIFKVNANGTLGAQFGGDNIISGTTVSNDSTKINDGNWHHVALVVDPKNNVKFYVDGKLSSTHAKQLSTGTDANLIVGLSMYRPYGDFFTGDIDDFKIYTKSFSDQEVQALYARASSQVAGAGAADKGIMSKIINFISSIFGKIF